MPDAAILGAKAKHNGPHCHAPIHPPAPVPTPMPHPCSQGHPIVLNCAATVMINNKPAVTVMSQTPTCAGEQAGCIPGGPGMVTLGCFTVLVCNMPAGRKDDMVMFPSCVGPVPMPIAKIDSGCSTDVKIG